MVVTLQYIHADSLSERLMLVVLAAAPRATEDLGVVGILRGARRPHVAVARVAAGAPASRHAEKV